MKANSNYSHLQTSRLFAQDRPLRKYRGFAPSIIAIIRVVKETHPDTRQL